MRWLSIDIETYSDLDIKKVGAYRYAENCEILLFAYAFDDEPVQVVDLTAGEKIPGSVLRAFTDPEIMKSAYNAAFEMAVLRKQMHIDIYPIQWLCTMVQGFTLGLPGGLEKLGNALGLPEDKKKLATGKCLITYFCRPCKPTKANGGRTRNNPFDDPEKWEQFVEYNRQDVEAERYIRKKITFRLPSAKERQLWCLDYQINTAGVLVDMGMVESAIRLDDLIKAEVLEDARQLTGMGNPNSDKQVAEFFEEHTGYRPKSLDKEFRAEYLKHGGDETVKEFFRMKNLLAKTSVKKYEAMKRMICRDGRVHGMLQFYGAGRTGRWAGRGVQLHNLPQNHLDDLDDARAIVRSTDIEALKMFYDNPSDVLSQLIRTAFVPMEGCIFYVADFSAIEARVIAWLADEKWRQEAFARGEDIYCASASQMFGVPVVKHGENGELRAKGKIAELACGYGGGIGALKNFGADKMGLSEMEMSDIISKWRKKSPNICKLWQTVEKAAKRALRMKGTSVAINHGISFHREKGFLFITLPSGRQIAYAQPKIEVEDNYGKESITYMGSTEKRAWGRVYTWGGKLVENIVQATARDCLAESMLRLERAGYRIVMHVHDEVIIEEPVRFNTLETITNFMGKPIPWAEGLLLTADGYSTKYYRKD